MQWAESRESFTVPNKGMSLIHFDMYAWYANQTDSQKNVVCSKSKSLPSNTNHYMNLWLINAYI